MSTDPKIRECRLSRIFKKSDTKPFADSFIGHKFTITYIVRGVKHIRSGSVSRRFSGGDIVCTTIGIFDIENIPDGSGVYEETAIEYSAAEFQNIITRLHLVHGIGIDSSSNRHGLKRFCGCRAAKVVASLFEEIGRNIDTGMTDEYVASRRSELVYLLMTYADNDTVNCILENMDSDTEMFVCTIYENIFVDCTLEELAAKCHRSLSAFKAEFKRIFGDTPHHWITEQRMKRACFLLLNTDKSISEIGYECIHGNPSHFINKFRRYYGITPAAYRRGMRVQAFATCEE